MKSTETLEDLNKRLNALKKEKQSTENEISKLEDKIQQEQRKNAPKKIFDTANTLPKVYAHLKCDPTKDVIKIDGFDEEDLEVLTNIVARMRIARVYNNGQVPKRGDRRWYPWSYLKTPGPGLVFYNSRCSADSAGASSAARLAFLSEESSDAYFKNFQHVEEAIIGL